MAALDPFLPNLVFISTIIQVPHAIKRVSHVYAITLRANHGAKYAE
jgi:hypothetical protein